MRMPQTPRTNRLLTPETSSWLHHFLVVATLTSLTPLFCGCVQRRMMIRSNPPGALVYIDDYEIGVTPIATNFTYYGTRQIRLVKDGFETLTVMERINPPWYQITPIDFVTENFVPGEIRDTRTLTYQLKPQTVCPPEELLSRAEQLRNQMYTADGTAVPSTLVPASNPPTVPSTAPAVAPPGPYGPPAESIPAGTPSYPAPGNSGMTPYPSTAPNTVAPPSNGSPYPVYPSTNGSGGTSVYPLPGA